MLQVRQSLLRNFTLPRLQEARENVIHLLLNVGRCAEALGVDDLGEDLCLQIVEEHGAQVRGKVLLVVVTAAQFLSGHYEFPELTRRDHLLLELAVVIVRIEAHVILLETVKCLAHFGQFGKRRVLGPVVVLEDLLRYLIRLLLHLNGVELVLKELLDSDEGALQKLHALVSVRVVHDRKHKAVVLDALVCHEAHDRR